jgi:centromere protein I
VRIRHAGPITQKTLITLGKEGGVKVDWKEYRVHVLRWLEGMGVGGVRELGGATMKGLLGGPETPVGMKGGIAA